MVHRLGKEVACKHGCGKMLRSQGRHDKWCPVLRLRKSGTLPRIPEELSVPPVRTRLEEVQHRMDTVPFSFTIWFTNEEGKTVKYSRSIRVCESTRTNDQEVE